VRTTVWFAFRRVASHNSLMARWKLESPPTARDVNERIAECESEVATLQLEIATLRKYLAVLTELTEPSNSKASQKAPDDPGTEDGWIPDMEAADTTEVVRAILHSNNGPMYLRGILAQTHSFPNWERTGDEKRDRDRIGAALRRGKKHFVRVEEFKWDLKSRAH
jgi:hypothetical protein